MIRAVLAEYFTAREIRRVLTEPESKLADLAARCKQQWREGATDVVRWRTCTDGIIWSDPAGRPHRTGVVLWWEAWHIIASPRWSRSGVGAARALLAVVKAATAHRASSPLIPDVDTPAEVAAKADLLAAAAVTEQMTLRICHWKRRPVSAPPPSTGGADPTTRRPATPPLTGQPALFTLKQPIE